MIGDGVNDGRFTIKNGGLSQAIRDELGLTQADCKKLKLSVWNQIFAEVKADNETQGGKIYSGGSDLTGAVNKNFIVQKDQVIEFSKTTWDNIVRIVNNALGKEIKTPTTEAPEIPPLTCPETHSNDPHPPKRINIPIAMQYPMPAFANQTVKQADGTFIEYDGEGEPKCLYDKDNRLILEIGSARGYDYFLTAYEYDDKGFCKRKLEGGDDSLSGKITEYVDYEYNDKGKKAKAVAYDASGNLVCSQYHEYDDKGNRTRHISYDSVGKLDWFKVWKYDDKGVKIECIEYDDKGKRLD